MPMMMTRRVHSNRSTWWYTLLASWFLFGVVSFPGSAVKQWMNYSCCDAKGKRCMIPYRKYSYVRMYVGVCRCYCSRPTNCSSVGTTPHQDFMRVRTRRRIFHAGNDAYGTTKTIVSYRMRGSESERACIVIDLQLELR
jgi:hypothetical protein